VLPQVAQNHPHPRQLERFMANDLPRSQRAEVIRHLLRGCPECAQVTGQIWKWGGEEGGR
jgi:hypothetical protein